MSSLWVMVKRSRGKKQQEEMEEQQHVIETENNLFKRFTTKGIPNYDRKSSGKLGSDCRWRCQSTGKESSTAWGIPCDATVKLAELLLVVISNSFCSKTFKWSVFCCNNVVLFLSFVLLLFPSASFNQKSQRRHFQRYIPMWYLSLHP